MELRRGGARQDRRGLAQREPGSCQHPCADRRYARSASHRAASADRLLAVMRSHPLGRDARVIGTVTDQHPRTVVMRTAFGTTRIVDMLSGDQLPRIC